MHNPADSPTFGSPPAGLQHPPQQQQQQSSPTSASKPPSSWSGRRFFARRVQSMQPPLRAADDATDPAQLKRSQSESKQFDGWPFSGGSGSRNSGGSGSGSVSGIQRFSVGGLAAAAVQPLLTRKSSDSAPAS